LDRFELYSPFASAAAAFLFKPRSTFNRPQIALVALLRGLLAGPDDDVEGLADAVIAADVGSVVKSQGYADALGVITILDMATSKPWASQIARLAGIESSSNSSSSTAAAATTTPDVDRNSLGLIVNERIVNMPTLRLAPAMHRSLFNELAERGPGAKQFERFLLIAPFFETTQRGASEPASKGHKRGKVCEFLRPEEEVFVEAAERATRIFLPAAGAAALSTEDDGAVIPSANMPGYMHTAMAAIIDARRIPETLTKIDRLFSN